MFRIRLLQQLCAGLLFLFRIAGINAHLRLRVFREVEK